jgi:hypothetical protein
MTVNNNNIFWEDTVTVSKEMGYENIADYRE